jgi:PhnB protein
MNEMVLANRAADWRRLKMLVLDSVSSPITKRVYNLGLDEFFDWFGKESRQGFTKATVSAWRVALEARGLGSISINVPNFYQKAFGFQKRGIMNGPDGKPMHAELTMRGTTLMLGPEMPGMGARSAINVGASPTTLYLLVENVDKTVAKAVKLGAKPQGPVSDMFWGDRCGRLVDPEGYSWYVATHIADPTPAQMKKQMVEDMKKWQAQGEGQSNAAATNMS